jgi:hypothetical protein
MTEAGSSVRRFNEEEVALIIKRAAELQQTEQIAQEPSTALSLAEIEQIAREAGIDPRLIRHAAQGLDRPAETNRPSAWAGAPTRLVFERIIDGEISNDEHEALVNEIRRTLGDNGLPSVLGRTLAWNSTPLGGRRRSRGRQVSVSVTSRGGVTTIRVEEELRHVAGPIFGGLMGGGAGGTTGISIGIGMGALNSPPAAALIWIAVAGGFYMLARTIFGHIAEKRERQLSDLADRLAQQVTAVAVMPQAQVAASSTTALPGTGAVAAAGG